MKNKKKKWIFGVTPLKIKIDPRLDQSPLKLFLNFF